MYLYSSLSEEPSDLLTKVKIYSKYFSFINAKNTYQKITKQGRTATLSETYSPKRAPEISNWDFRTALLFLNPTFRVELDKLEQNIENPELISRGRLYNGEAIYRLIHDFEFRWGVFVYHFLHSGNKSPNVFAKESQLDKRHPTHFLTSEVKFNQASKTNINWGVGIVNVKGLLVRSKIMTSPVKAFQSRDLLEIARSKILEDIYISVDRNFDLKNITKFIKEISLEMRFCTFPSKKTTYDTLDLRPFQNLFYLDVAYHKNILNMSTKDFLIQQDFPESRIEAGVKNVDKNWGRIRKIVIPL